jgi:hypothetical protein
MANRISKVIRAAEIHIIDVLAPMTNVENLYRGTTDRLWESVTQLQTPFSPG